jgi:hypothetical protein
MVSGPANPASICSTLCDTLAISVRAHNPQMRQPNSPCRVALTGLTDRHRIVADTPGAAARRLARIAHFGQPTPPGPGPRRAEAGPLRTVYP